MHFARKMRIGWISSNAKSFLGDPSQQRAAAPWWGVTLSPTFGDAGGFGIPEETLGDLRSQEFEALQKYSSLNVCHMKGNRNMGREGEIKNMLWAWDGSGHQGEKHTHFLHFSSGKGCSLPQTGHPQATRAALGEGKFGNSNTFQQHQQLNSSSPSWRCASFLCRAGRAALKQLIRGLKCNKLYDSKRVFNGIKWYLIP